MFIKKRQKNNEVLHEKERCVIPTYDYGCEECGFVKEVRHMMSESPEIECPECGHNFMAKQMSSTFYVAQSYHACPTMEDRKEEEHHKKVKDLDRAVRSRKQAFGHDAVGDPVDKPDPRHIIKKGRTLGGQEMEVDKTELTKALAKDDVAVDVAKKALKKSKTKK